MEDLIKCGKYKITTDELSKIREIFDADCADDEETYATIKSVYEKYGYLIDTHTAVAWNVYEKWSPKNANGCKSIVLSTASAYKFSSGVLHSLGLECPNEFDAIEILAKRTGIRPPKVISNIKNKKIIHSNTIKKESMITLVERIIRRNKVIVRVPATSANLGSGFDCTGIAFRKYDIFSFEKTNGTVEFENFDSAFSNENNLAYVAYKKVCDAVGADGFVKIKSIRTDIPITRGLGSSAALIVAGAYAANILTGQKLSPQEIFEICNLIEGHPDNIAPAIFGGLCTSIVADGKPKAQKYSVSDAICFTAVIPDFKVDTKDARAVLPQNISRADAIFNMQRVALLPYAFEHGCPELIKLVTEDRLHESYRKPLFKNINQVEQAAYECGAISFAVSGAGPTCLAFSTVQISDKLNEKISILENNWVALSVSVDNEGAKEIYDEQ